MGDGWAEAGGGRHLSLIRPAAQPVRTPMGARRLQVTDAKPDPAIHGKRVTPVMQLGNVQAQLHPTRQ